MSNFIYFNGQVYDTSKFTDPVALGQIIAYNLSMLNQYTSALKLNRDYVCRMTQAIQTVGPEKVTTEIDHLIQDTYVP